MPALVILLSGRPRPAARLQSHPKKFVLSVRLSVRSARIKPNQSQCKHCVLLVPSPQQNYMSLCPPVVAAASNAFAYRTQIFHPLLWRRSRGSVGRSRIVGRDLETCASFPSLLAATVPGARRYVNFPTLYVRIAPASRFRTAISSHKANYFYCFSLPPCAIISFTARSAIIDRPAAFYWRDVRSIFGWSYFVRILLHK